MSVKIKISYQDEKELVTIKRLLDPIKGSCKISRNQEGRYRKAYIIADEIKVKRGIEGLTSKIIAS